MMKKSLIALAALAAAGAASAQSSVTLFGIVDVNFAHYSVSGGDSLNVLANSGYNSARLGFRGTEDLGGGMSASFWLESALGPDNGTAGSNSAGALDFKRRSTVSLAGNWGELRLGRDYTPTFWNLTIFDPFGTNGVGTNVGFKQRLNLADPNVVRANNSVAYFLPPNLGGFYGQATYAFDELTTSNYGQYKGLRVGYASGPFNVAAAWGTTDAGNPKSATQPSVRDFNIGGQWDFGVAQLLGQYDDAKYDNGVTSPSQVTWLIGGLVPVGAGQIRISYATTKLESTGGAEPKSDQWALGYVHNLSKRTALYATYAHVSNKDGAALAIFPSPVAGIANKSSDGFDLGIRHSF